MDHHTSQKTPPRGRRESYHHGDLRRDLLRVAREEIAANGAEGVSLASLARLAGVVQSAPYRHFADRKALLEAVAAEGFMALTQAMRNAVAKQPSSLPAGDALAYAYIRFGEANIELYRLMFASKLTPEAPNGSGLDEAAGKAFDLLWTTIVSDNREHDEAAHEHSVYLAWAKIHGLVMLKADGFITSSLEKYI